MTDILITFEDGTTELRDADSYVHWLPPWKLVGRGITRAERVDIASGRAAGLWQMRGAPMATVWRTTWDPETKVLTGAWASCRVETMAEQIERLTRERDATARHLTAAVAKAIALRDAEHRRAEAAERRLADLRAWADELANGQSDTREGRRVAGDFRAVVRRMGVTVITKEERERDRATCEAATPPPWVHEGGRMFRCRPNGDSVPARTTEDALFMVRARAALPAYIAAAEEMERQSEMLRAFVREIATGYDHDEDAHRHRNGACRVCNAEKLAAELGFGIEEDAR